MSIPISRRTCIAWLGAATAGGIPSIARGARPKVVVIGGGVGGATAARLLATDAGLDAQVTLVEPSRTYHTCFFSNLYLGGFRDHASLSHGYEKLAAMDRLEVVHERAQAIDRGARSVTLTGGARLDYDRLVLAPGIDLDYDSVPGYSEHGAQRAPHAWTSGTQVQRLRELALAMRPGGTFVFVPPPDPSRCPPGSYERVSMLAHLFRTRNPRARIVILDTKETFTKQALFEAAWSRYYPGMITWLPPSVSGGLIEVDLDSLTFRTGGEDIKADAASVIPAQRAGAIAARADLTDISGWCPIVPATLQSATDPHIHVVGDAAITARMPKSAFAANNQAHAVARAIRHALLGEPQESPVYANTCWSLLAENDSVKVGALYRAGEAYIESTGGFVSQPGDSDEVRAANARDARAWYQGIVRDMFG